MYQTVRAERLYQQIVGQIERRILDGELAVGDRLPPERQLGQQFGVSRTAIREAVKALHQKGLVQVFPGRGTFITDGTSNAVRHSFDFLTKSERVRGSGNLVEVREMLEPEIAALAATRAQPAHIAALGRVVATMDAALHDADTFIQADLDFHRALAEATGNPLVLALIDSIVDLLREQRTRIFFVAGGATRGQIHHKAILKAVTRGNAAAARRAMRAHMAQVRADSAASRKAARHHSTRRR